MAQIRMIRKHLCIIGMLGIILLPLLCSVSFISPNFDVKSVIFPNFGQGLFFQNYWKKP